MKKLSKMCYETLSSASTNGFDNQTSDTLSFLCSDVETRLRYILQILPKPLRNEYVDCVWSNLRAAIGWGDDDEVSTSDNVDDDRNRWWPNTSLPKTKSVMKLVDWYANTERIISVVSEFIPGYRPIKRFPTSGVKREGRVTMIWWDTYGFRSFCGEYHETACCCWHYDDRD